MNAITPAREAARRLRLIELRGIVERCLALAPHGDGAPGWWVSYDHRLLRLERRVDALIGAPNALVAVLYRPGASGVADRRLAEDAALDVADFLHGAASVPVLPVVLTLASVRGPGATLPLAGANGVRVVDPAGLAELFGAVAARFPAACGPAPDWQAARYRPVPTLVEAACTLFSRRGAAELMAARSPADALGRTRRAIARHVAGAHGPTVVFVTGAPGAGKTLCGLEAAFAQRGAFLTGNPTLVHVLREALARDAAERGAQPRAARQRMRAVIQQLRDFRDHHLGSSDPPADRLVVIDEAQRCWTASTARLRSRERAVRLTDSEPGHLLDVLQRRADAVVLCLLGGGQEIHEGEGGLACWGEALAQRPAWRAVAPPTVSDDPRQSLPDLPGLTVDADLHLGAPLRSIGSDAANAWVDAVLEGDAARAAAAAAAGTPFHVTRSLDAARRALRARARGLQRAGLVASAQGKRLRAEGLGGTLPHMDKDAVARWFLDRAPDLRSAGALEVAATEFAVQGLELDHVGLCWDGDLLRQRGRWVARTLRGAAWSTPHRSETASNRLNAYRVLLTRARHGTVIWVPPGDPSDPTRRPSDYDAVADYLLRCGAAPLAAPPAADAAPAPLLV